MAQKVPMPLALETRPFRSFSICRGVYIHIGLGDDIDHPAPSANVCYEWNFVLLTSSFEQSLNSEKKEKKIETGILNKNKF